ELRRRLGEQGLCVVDLRPLPEYNGWRAGTAERGGHVPGAVSLPVGWLSRLDDAELLALLESKGIVSSDEVVVYGDPEAVSLFRVNFGVPEEYADSHLPGALYLDTNQLESARDWNRRSPEELDAAVRALGITRETTVILYGRDTEGGANEKWPGRRAGQIAAT